MKSNCCNYEVTVNYGEEGTNCWICGKCWKPCDICPQESEPLKMTFKEAKEKIRKESLEADAKRQEYRMKRSLNESLEKPEPKEGWMIEFDERFLEYRGTRNGLEYLRGNVRGNDIKPFISSLIAQTRKDTLEEVRQWAEEHNLCSDLVATSSLMRFLDSLKKGKI